MTSINVSSNDYDRLADTMERGLIRHGSLLMNTEERLIESGPETFSGEQIDMQDSKTIRHGCNNVVDSA